MKQSISNRLTSHRNLSYHLPALSVMLVAFNLPAFTYTNFNSTNGLSLVGASAVVGGALRLTPAVQSVTGEAWAIAKQPCSSGFDTTFQFRLGNLGGLPGVPIGGDGLVFAVQKIGPTNPNCYGVGSPADGSVSVLYNTFWNWPDSTDFTLWDISGNSVGVHLNGRYLAQTDLTPRGINLEDGAVHNSRIAFDGTGLTVWLDGVIVLTNVPVPGLATAVDASGQAWVGFGAGTGWAWDTPDILSWSFGGTSLNHPPVAQCADAIVSPGANCQANASINNGSFDPDGDPITVRQEPPGPYPLGTNRVTLIVTDDKGTSNSCSALVIVMNNLPAFTYTNFSSTDGLSLVGTAAVVGGALRLNPAAQSVGGAAWAVAKQPCSGGFDTSFQLRFSSQGSVPGTPSGGDGIAFTLQKIGPTDPPNGLTSPADGSISVYFNTFWNWPDSTDFTHWDVSGNSVGVLSNGLYLAQTDLTPRGINLKDGAVHNARVAFDGTGLAVWLDGVMVLTNVPVPSMASAVDADGKAWVGFGAFTGWGWENHDILSWSFLNSSLNRTPVAQCANVIVSAGANCQANASINNGSFDPDGDPIIVLQEPPGPYPLGTNRVTLIVTDNKCASNSCSALVVVLDRTPPALNCPGGQVVEFKDEKGAVATYSVTATDACSEVILVVTPPSGSLFPIGVTPVQARATDGSGNSVQCAFDVAVLGARGVKSNVLAQLVALRQAGTNRFDCWELSEAIEDMIDALGLEATNAPRWVVEAHRTEHCGQHHHHPAGPLWLDETHVNRARGGWVFANEKDAVQELAEIIRNRRSGIADAVALNLIERLVRCDRLLAVVSIQDAAKAGANPKKIAQASMEVAAGDQDAVGGRPAQAIDHYWRAWARVGPINPPAIGRIAHGKMNVQFAGKDASRTYVVQASTNLVDWVTVGSVIADAEGSVTYTDPDSDKHPARFYRAVEQ